MEYAIVETGGKQYKVSPGLTFDIESLGKTSGEVVFEKVLLTVSDGKVKIGTPSISGVTIKAKILGASKGEKIYVSKFKAKSRYRKTMGHRQSLTSVEVLPFAEAKEAKKAVEKSKKKEKV